MSLVLPDEILDIVTILIDPELHLLVSKTAQSPRKANEGATHFEDKVEAGEGWLPSDTPLLGELWSLSPLLLQVCSGRLASSLNSWPDMIRSISSSEIWGG